MKKNSGVSIAEYGLIMTLLAIALIAGLSILGINLSNGLANSGDLSRADDLFALLDANKNGPVAGGNNAVNTQASSSPTSSVAGSSSNNFAGQTYTFTVGSISTSAEGAEVASDMLKALANQKVVNGDQIFEEDWSGIQDLLDQLAAQGYKIAHYEEKALKSEESSDLTSVQDGNYDYVQIHRTLAAKIEDSLIRNPAVRGHPEFETFMRLLQTSSGVITHGAQNYVATLGQNNDNYDDFSLDRSKLDTVGVAYQPGSVVEIPTVTDAASGNLNQATSPI